MKKILCLAVIALAVAVVRADCQEKKPIDIGSRLEPFVDEFLIEKKTGDLELQLHKPKPREVVLVTSHPWEGNTCAYYTIFRDGNIFRMYYRGSHYDVKTKRAAHREVACYAESKDGIHWTKPELGLFTFNGSKKNNIIWDGVGTHNFTPFKDANPNCPKDAQYKAIARASGKYKRGLYAFQSPDGIRWKLMQQEPVITLGAFDSQNLAFWDPHAKIYREYHRGFKSGVRAIMTGTSEDFLKWTTPKYLHYVSKINEHLYTNAIQPYPRAPHILVGFPTRFQPRQQQVEPIFMTSRDGMTFRRWSEALIPKTAPKDRGGNRSNYMTWGLVQLPDSKTEYSMYATEAYYTGPDSRVRRFTIRIDGFVSIRGGEKGGELITKPFRFRGKKLVLNYATSNKGTIRVEVLDHQSGKPLQSHTLAKCNPLHGDSIVQAVTWSGESDIGSLAGRAIRLRFQLANADLYSMRFEN